MSLDALAPDQRAVVQLVLQQDRSYEDLAVLLGISTDAVRERAHKGLERLAPGEAIDAADRAEISDYLLGQQAVSGRESTRALLASSQPARSWALAVAGQLAAVARGDLPEVPAAHAPPGRRPEPEPEQEPVDAPLEPVGAEEPVVPTRARPRPRQRAAAATPTPARDTGLDDETDDEPATPPALGDERGARPRSSLWGGALLIGGLGIIVALLVVWLVSKDGGDSGSAAQDTTTTQPQGSPTATGTPAFEPIGQLNLRASDGGDARGQMVVFASPGGDVAFTIQGTGLPPSAEGSAYGVWLTGGDKPHFLGFAPPVGEDGKFGTSGPRKSDAANFPTWLSSAKQVIVSRETEEGATEPGPAVLEGEVATGTSGGSGDAAATPNP